MAFVDDYQRLKNALAQKKPTSEQITTFIQAFDNVLSELDNQQGDYSDWDQQWLKLYLNEAGEPADYNNLSSLGRVILPFLAESLQGAMGDQRCRLMIQFQGTGVIRYRGDFLTSDFADNLFTYIDLPLNLRRTLFKRLQKMTQAAMESNIANMGDNLTDELKKRRHGEGLLALAHLHRLGRLKNITKKERKTLIFILSVNDPLVKELVTKWGLQGSKFDWQALQTAFSQYFSRRLLRARKKFVGKIEGRIALFGCRAAGKTVYMASLYDAYNARTSGLQVSFDGAQSGVYLAELQKSILKHPRTWPAPNVKENEVRLTLELESALAAASPTVNIQFFDPPGEWLALSTAKQEQAASNNRQKMLDFVAEADGIFFFFEPDNFAFQVLRDKIKRALPELQDWAQNVDKRLDDLITTLKTKEGNILAQLQSENFLVPLVEKDDQEEMVREIEGVLDSKENIDSRLKGLFRDAELKYLLRKYELNVEPILAEAQESSQTRTPSGKPVDVLFRIIELIQESAASEDKDTELLQDIVSYFKIESNNRLTAAMERLQEIRKKAERKSNAAERSIALIIAKADELEVFRQSPEKPYVLIPPELEHLKFKSDDDRFSNFREALEDYWEKQDPRWPAIINQLFNGPFKGLFLRLMNFPGDFQIFFVSSVGKVERDKSGFVQPPPGENDFKPKGVDQPVLWTARKIYSHAMVHQAKRRLLRGAIWLLVLLLISLLFYLFLK